LELELVVFDRLLRARTKKEGRQLFQEKSAAFFDESDK